MTAALRLTVARWTEYSPGRFRVEVAPTAAYGVSFDLGSYYLCLPGEGIRKCWNRAQVERYAFDAYERQLDALAEDAAFADDEAEFAEYHRQRAYERSMRTVG